VIDPQAISSRLVLEEPGLWSGGDPSEVSYPAWGNELCGELEDESFWFSHRSNCIVDVIRLFPPQGTLLDIGGGNGLVSLALRNAGIEAVVVEPLAVGARNALKRGLSPVIRSTFEGVGFTDGSVPAIGLFDVLEHISDDSAFLTAVRHALVPGGHLFITVPAHQWLWSTQDEFAGHYRRYSLGGLATKLEDSGFRVQFATYMFWFAPLAILLFRKLPERVRATRRECAEAVRREHKPMPLVGLVNRLLGLERRLIARARRVPCGSSCLIVARSRQ
jgi:SAM-dependent methyltransferase